MINRALEPSAPTFAENNAMQIAYAMQPLAYHVNRDNRLDRKVVPINERVYVLNRNVPVIHHGRYGQQTCTTGTLAVTQDGDVLTITDNLLLDRKPAFPTILQDDGQAHVFCREECRRQSTISGRDATTDPNSVTPETTCQQCHGELPWPTTLDAAPTLTPPGKAKPPAHHPEYTMGTEQILQAITQQIRLCPSQWLDEQLPPDEIKEIEDSEGTTYTRDDIAGQLACDLMNGDRQLPNSLDNEHTREIQRLLDLPNND